MINIDYNIEFDVSRWAETLVGLAEDVDLELVVEALEGRGVFERDAISAVASLVGYAKSAEMLIQERPL